MNEKQLKSLFCNALATGHIKNNDILPISTGHNRIKVVEEASFRSFDLIVSEITREPIIDDHYDSYSNNILMRTQLLELFARSQRCRIDCIRFYPIEIKSDDDVIDERLPNQILNAILTFGLSVLVLDKNHARRIKSSALKFLPATVIGYLGNEDHFEVISKFDRFVSNGLFSFNKSTIANMLSQNKGSNSDKKNSTRIHSRLGTIQAILQKLMFNQIYYENLGLTEEEFELLQRIAEVPLFSQGTISNKRLLNRLIKETTNAKLTDFM
jgi:hypothetical protein